MKNALIAVVVGAAVGGVATVTGVSAYQEDVATPASQNLYSYADE